MKKIVISGVNFTEGGPLSVLKDCLSSFKKIYLEQDIQLTVFVHKKSLVAEFINDFTIIEYPLVKSSWLKRIRFEYFECKKISESLKPDLWIALHDMTPNVSCPQVVYCHNPSPFYKLKLKDAFVDPTFFLFCLFYSFLYRINISKNKFVIVQQQWLREAFERKYHVKTVVSYPFFEELDQPLYQQQTVVTPKFIFFFPAFPRVAKNFEVFLEATKKLSSRRSDFQVILSINGAENNYSKSLFKTFGDIDAIKFIGAQTRIQVFELYGSVDCMVFPSKLETWGLPISEFKTFEKPMLLADLQYAHEALGAYKSVKFFDPDDADQLSFFMNNIIDKRLDFDGNKQIVPSLPFFKNWDDLTNYLSNATF